MKTTKALILSAILPLISISAMAQDYGPTMRETVVFDNVAIATGGSNLSTAVDFFTERPIAFAFALQLSSTNQITNSGPATVSWEASNNGTDWSVSSNIVTGFNFTNSPSAGGKGLFWFSMPGPARFMRLKAAVSQTNAYLSGKLIFH